ncbi:MAG TPA: bifunctional phosphopantothenoylcysteine decarboxylase/phosphopantothenate--cysteine ligase CoaBC [Sporichthyaceae bacterium]|nr:bifunctional phosphopantothenoylcysteine decarboxylase/phosphopantothenate--cysteine ligase CoaBC [Sporichthyaceae bacterium]
MSLDPPNIVLGVAGGIAAYKSCELLRRFTEGGATVTVVPTASALKFVGAATWAALSGRPVATDVFDDVHEVPHVRLGQRADLVVVAPATADLMARAAMGRADDLLTATLLTARCPVLFAPAMHTEMWLHPATRENVATLRRRGSVVLDPAWGRLTGADTGPGRLPEPEQIYAVAQRLLSRGNLPADLTGRRVLVSAGGTREPVDPVRFLGNRSTGLQGWALATTAAARGAEVVLVAANVELPDPAGAKVIRVETALELRAAVLEAASEADVIVMAAAVADFRPVNPAGAKLKKGDVDPDPIALTRNPDVLAELCARPHPGQVIVGFAAETGDATASVLEHGRAKLARKQCDLLVVNEVGPTKAFGTPDNQAVILGLDSSTTEVPSGPKENLADVIWDLALARLPER